MIILTGIVVAESFVQVIRVMVWAVFISVTVVDVIERYPMSTVSYLPGHPISPDVPRRSVITE